MRRKMRPKRSTRLRYYQSGLAKSMTFNSGDVVYSCVITQGSGWANALSPAIELIPNYKKFIVRIGSLQTTQRFHVVPCLVRTSGVTTPADYSDDANAEIHAVIDAMFTAEHTTEVLKPLPFARFGWYDATGGNHYLSAGSYDLTDVMNAYTRKRYSQPGAVDTDLQLVLVGFNSTGLGGGIGITGVIEAEYGLSPAPVTN